MGSPKLIKIDGGAQTAEGSSLKVLGAMKINVQMGNETYPYRAWVIVNLQSDILLGLDFKSFYEVYTLQSTRELKIRPCTIPFTLEGWGRKMQKNLRSKVQVVAVATLDIPAGYGRDIPVRIASKIPREWKGRTKMFVPSRTVGTMCGPGNVVGSNHQHRKRERVCGSEHIPWTC